MRACLDVCLAEVVDLTAGRGDTSDDKSFRPPHSDVSLKTTERQCQDGNAVFYQSGDRTERFSLESVRTKSISPVIHFRYAMNSDTRPWRRINRTSFEGKHSSLHSRLAMRVALLAFVRRLTYIFQTTRAARPVLLLSRFALYSESLRSVNEKCETDGVY